MEALKDDFVEYKPYLQGSPHKRVIFEETTISWIIQTLL
jgi:hypothetical protein